MFFSQSFYCYNPPRCSLHSLLTMPAFSFIDKTVCSKVLAHLLSILADWKLKSDCVLMRQLLCMSYSSCAQALQELIKLCWSLITAAISATKLLCGFPLFSLTTSSKSQLQASMAFIRFPSSSYSDLTIFSNQTMIFCFQSSRSSKWLLKILSQTNKLGIISFFEADSFVLCYVYFLLTELFFLLSNDRTLLTREKEACRIEVSILPLAFYVEREAVTPFPSSCCSNSTFYRNYWISDQYLRCSYISNCLMFY